MPEMGTPASTGRRWTRGERILLAASLLLVADLLLLPWHDYSLDMSGLGVDVPSFSIERTGVQSPEAAFGITAVGIALGMALHTVAAKLSPAVPRLEQIHLVAGAVVLGLVLAKLLADREFLGIGAWAGTALAFAVAYGGFALSQETPAASDTTATDTNRPQ